MKPLPEILELSESRKEAIRKFDEAMLPYLDRWVALQHSLGDLSNWVITRYFKFVSMDENFMYYKTGDEWNFVKLSIPLKFIADPTGYVSTQFTEEEKDRIRKAQEENLAHLEASRARYEAELIDTNYQISLSCHPSATRAAYFDNEIAKLKSYMV